MDWQDRISHSMAWREEHLEVEVDREGAAPG